MALIICRECGKQISDTAETCPNCGYKNFTSTVVITNPYNGKKNIVLGKIMVIVGLIFLLIGSLNTLTALVGLGVLILIIGVIILSVGRFQHWWHWR